MWQNLRIYNMCLWELSFNNMCLNLNNYGNNSSLKSNQFDCINTLLSAVIILFHIDIQYL